MLDDGDEHDRELAVKEFRANLPALVDEKLHEFLIRIEELEQRVATLEQAQKRPKISPLRYPERRF